MWYLKPGWGAWLLFFPLLPWIIRMLSGRSPVKRTYFDLLLLVFLLSAGVGVWAAYNQQAALAKFWQIVASIFLFYALAGQPKKNLWIVCGILSGLAALLSIYFLLSYDFSAQPADIALLNRFARVWVSFRPALPPPDLNSNMFGGIMAVLFPFIIAFGVLARKGKRTEMVFLAVTFGFIALAGLLMTSSRGAWAALAAGIALWLLWEASRWLSGGRQRRQRTLFAAIFLACMAGMTFLAATKLDLLVAWADKLPGANSAESRLEIARNTISLVKDFPFTGGGLASFSGLYSRYVLLIPNILFGYSHDLYLDLAVEQGLLGLVLVLILFAGSLVLTVASKVDPIIRWAILAGMVVFVLHGFVDDALYGVRGTALLFFLPGMSFASSQIDKELSPVHPDKTHSFWSELVLVLAPVGAILIFFLVSGMGESAWFANLGAVRVARIELSDYPLGVRNPGKDISTDSPAVSDLKRAITLNPNERTAQQRLGLIALDRQNFQEAIAHLESAYQVDPGNRNVRKALGYAYGWSGNPQKAMFLLTGLPETGKELREYTFWWQAEGRGDLARASGTLADTINSQSSGATAGGRTKRP
jgi:O-antigen ligase